MSMRGAHRKRAHRRTRTRTRMQLLCSLFLAIVGPAYRRSLVFLADAQTCVPTGSIRIADATAAAALNDALNCSEGAEVEVVWAGSVTLTAAISVGAGTLLSITGEGDDAQILGEAEQGIRLFEVSRGGSLFLTGLTVSGGSAYDGGAIYSQAGTIDVNNCSFTDNAATNSGGAVWVDGGNLTITGGEFSRNTAQVYGGAVYSVNASVQVQNATRFADNSAERGGGLYCGDSETSSATTTYLCSLSEATFLRNTATSPNEVDFDDIVDFDDTSEGENPWAKVYGGGGAAFSNANVMLADCVFEENTAQVAGGGLFGGSGTNVSISACRFERNNATGYGAALAVSSATIGGGTELRLNEADRNAGAVFAWDDTGKVEFDEMVCADNVCEENGGCLYASGAVVITNQTVMRDNQAELGGCIYAFAGCDLEISGGEFTCRATRNGGFMYAADGSVVSIVNGSFSNNVADRRGGAVYCSGDNNEKGGSAVTIKGGLFADNEAHELGGAINAWGTTSDGTPLVVTVEGGTFRNNTGQYYGGFIFLEEEASLVCANATIIGNYAGDQGGGIYARDATWVNSSCDLIANGAPQGAAAYVTNVKKRATFADHDVTDNVASGSSVLYFAESIVEARGVTFEITADEEEAASNRAVQLDSGSTLAGEKCVFRGWLGDTVIYNENPDDGSLVLDSCDFRESSATMVVMSPQSDAGVRNALIGNVTFANAEGVDGYPILVDRAMNCSREDACGVGQCVDSFLGVLCECLEDGTCLNDGGSMSLTLETSPDPETYSPDPVSFELLVSAGAEGTTDVIWELTYDADDLDLVVVPSSGVLHPGGKAAVSVTGTPQTNDVGGDLVSHFSLTSIGTRASESSAAGAVELPVTSTFYLCQAFEYAVPATSLDDDAEFSCEQCAAIDGADGVDCEEPGATLASLPILAGYWRSGRDEVVIHTCINSAACGGATAITSADDYCADGYEGPLCAICLDGYGRGVGNACHACDDSRARLLIAAGSILFVVIVLLIVLAVVFLIGGLDAVGNMHRSLANRLSVGKPSSKGADQSSRRATVSSVRDDGHAGRADALDSTLTPAFRPLSGEAAALGMRGPGGDQDTILRAAGMLCSGPGESPKSTISSEVTSAPRAGLMTMTRSDQDSCNWTSGRRTGGEGGVLDDDKPANDDPDNAQGLEDIDGRPGCCGFGERIKRWWARMPLDKLKILVVVWQILTVFPSITAVDFPPVYSRFLSWVDVVNLDLGQVFSASCLFPAVSFYDRLLFTTLAPIGLLAVLVMTYHLAKRRAGIGSVGMVARRAAWSRHMAAGLLLSFLVFTSASTSVFKTFGCDSSVVPTESYLRADYSISCNTDTHTYFQVYAGFMLLVYPVGIPCLYAFILWKNRHLLNPMVGATALATAAQEAAEEKEKASDDDAERGRGPTAKAGDAPDKRHLSPQQQEELDRMVKMRRTNPELVPSMFLWKDFGPDLYYYEVIECGRRILLTGVLIFIAPGSAAQAAMACIFAFASLLGFELLRPHLDPTDSWLYRLGCVVIFLSNFLALLIKVDSAGEGNRDILGGLLVAVNVFLVLAVLVTSWFSTQQEVDESRDDENSYTLAMTMVTAERLAAKDALHAHHAKATPMSAARSSGRSTRALLASSSAGSTSGWRVQMSSGAVAVDAPKRTNVSAAMVEELWQRDRASGADPR